MNTSNQKIDSPVKKFFSILIPTRNRPQLLKDLLDSIIVQNFEDFELVIADNSTNELSQKIIEELNDKRIVNIRTGQLNMADNWDQGIEKCSGKYLLLFSDKMLLKRGSLEYLASFISANNPECVNWDIDSFYDHEKCYLESERTQIDTQIKSTDLIEAMFISEFDSTRIPCHCNSAISMEVIEKIRKKTGRVSFQLNPDYTLSYQVCLNTQKILNLNKSLSILRYPNFKGGYGNGTSFMIKTEQAENFMKENFNWAESTNKYKDVRISSNLFGLDIILKDLYFILEKYNQDPDFFLSKQERHINYYFFTFREVIFRVNMNANMDNEISIWKKSLSKEPHFIQTSVLKMLRKSFFELKLVRFKRYLTSFYFLATFIHGIGDIMYRRRQIKYSSIEHCLDETEITIN